MTDTYVDEEAQPPVYQVVLIIPVLSLTLKPSHTYNQWCSPHWVAGTLTLVGHAYMSREWTPMQCLNGEEFA